MFVAESTRQVRAHCGVRPEWESLWAANASSFGRISTFYGIVITMDYRDHRPPHFHAIYGEYEAQIAIETLEPLASELPSRALRLVREWAQMHRAELKANWASAEARMSLDTIEPLS